MAPPSLNPNPKALFGTSLSDTRKLLSALINYSNRDVTNPLRGDEDTLNAVIQRESKEHPTFWTGVATEAIRAYKAFAGGEYTFASTGVDLFDTILAQLDISILDSDESAPRRNLLWSGSSGQARAMAPRAASVPPPSDSASTDAPSFNLFVSSASQVKGTPARATLPPVAAAPSQSKGKKNATPRRPSQSGDDPRASPTPSQGGPTRGDALIDSAIERFNALALPRLSSAPPLGTSRPGASHSFDTRPTSLGTGPSSTTLQADPPRVNGPRRRADRAGSGDSSDEDGDLAMGDPDDPSPIQDDLDFVSALVQRPAADSRIGSVGSALGQKIFNRTQAWRQLSNKQTREYALRSNAPLPLDVRIAIIRGEPVDYGKIPLYNPSAVFTRPLGDESLGLVLEAASPSTTIKTFAQWLDAHSKVVAYTLTLYEFRAEEFHSYTSWMRERATRTPYLFPRYIEFDHNVRHHLGMATYPDNLADAPGQFDLLNEIVHNPQHRQPPPSTSSSRPSSNKRSAPDSSSQACRRWNNGIEHEDDCRWAHRCSTCDSSQHIARDCRGGGGAGRVTKKAKGSGGGGGPIDPPPVSLRK